MTTMKDDSVSRAAVLNLIEQSCCDLEYNCDNVALRKEVEALPSAQTERKKGKWIERNPRNSPDCRLIECSECGNAYIVGYNINYDDWIDGRNFCMKCGADLRGGSNGKST